MTGRTGGARPSTKEIEGALLAQLGLDRSANPLAIESARDGIVNFLRTAPSEIRTWSQRQIERTDEAYALLSDPTADLSTSADAVDVAFAAAPVAPASVPTGAVAAPRGGNPISRLGPVAKAIVGGLVVVAIAGVIYGVYAIGQPAVPGINGSPAPVASAGGVDKAAVTALMEKISANPKDIESLQQLADIYYQAGDYVNSAGFEQKVLEIDPNNVTAHLALGASAFNSGDATTAASEWQKVVAIDPKNVEAHYDLGYMYLSQNPPDYANVKLEWNKVIELAPNSDVANTIKTHLASLDASGGTTGDASGATGASPSASPKN